jgi:hypothetical protein
MTTAHARIGTPDRTRTCYHRLRRPVLYPNELRAPCRLGAGSRTGGRTDDQTTFVLAGRATSPTEISPQIKRQNIAQRAPARSFHAWCGGSALPFPDVIGRPKCVGSLSDAPAARRRFKPRGLIQLFVKHRVSKILPRCSGLTVEGGSLYDSVVALQHFERFQHGAAAMVQLSDLSGESAARLHTSPRRPAQAIRRLPAAGQNTRRQRRPVGLRRSPDSPGEVAHDVEHVCRLRAGIAS